MGLDTSNLAPLRLSLGWSTTEDDIDTALTLIPEAVDRLRTHGGSNG
jgi:cysteine sulfinate desulfinase/cysteine desulfurase-like protein